MPYNYYENKKMEFTSLEKKFDKLVKEAKPLIDAQLKLASEAVARAVKLSMTHGVPFSASLLGASNTYVPKKFNDNFAEIEDLDPWDLYLDISSEGGDGWQTSYC